MIKIEISTALKDALEHAVASGTPQVALYKDKPVVILSYDEYERLSDEEQENQA
jgi:PHD/YefM family antitoxin component YafN of YafNO toxin-antitoxin module